MADPQPQVGMEHAQADVEQAPGTQLSDDATRPPWADGQSHPPEPATDILADKVIVLSFRNLQLKRIGALQDKLIGLSMAREPLLPDHADRVDETLRAYAQALRDYETLSVNALPTIPIGARLVGSMGTAGEEREITIPRTFGDRVAKLALKTFPGLEAFMFSLGSHRAMLRLLPGDSRNPLEWELLTKSFRIVSQRLSVNLGPSSAVDMMEESCGKLGFRELDQQGRLRRAEKQALTQRILMGIFGGIALICPVLVMVLYPSRNTNLVTVSVATILFAFLLAFGASDGTGKDVLAATAAYTAVLVVFFGTSGSST
ncbi:hypothetical protein INS49_015655 [Diaporthe citri]|uniref:uncharacterized protein n=1 Tax=Diaporthe citri TaxID=83186 RepID=UPI001C804F46|nr:uncharacterized protein INS49_015655 [Diaporthe citri]KAG6356268.1 hypothetical protein INS49_015655 [Diaporthe citri]